MTNTKTTTMKNYKAELVKDNKVIKTFEENSNLEWSKWRFGRALDNLKPRGEMIRWYCNNELILS